MQRQRVAPNGVTYTALISACGKMDQSECALELLETMQRQGLLPNVVNYNVLMRACETVR